MREPPHAGTERKLCKIFIQTSKRFLKYFQVSVTFFAGREVQAESSIIDARPVVTGEQDHRFVRRSLHWSGLSVSAPTSQRVYCTILSYYYFSTVIFTLQKIVYCAARKERIFTERKVCFPSEAISCVAKSTYSLMTITLPEVVELPEIDRERAISSITPVGVMILNCAQVNNDHRSIIGYFYIILKYCSS